MALSRKTEESLLERGYSRRQITRVALGAGAAIPFFSEFAQAQQAETRMARAANRVGGPRMRQTYDPDVIRITSNENPMGPSQQGIEAMARWAGDTTRKAKTSTLNPCSRAPKMSRPATSTPTPDPASPSLIAYLPSPRQPEAGSWDSRDTAAEPAVSSATKSSASPCAKTIHTTSRP